MIPCEIALGAISSPPTSRSDDRGTASTALLRRRRRGAALPPRRRPAAHLPAAAQPADRRARGRARLPPAGAHPAPRRADAGRRGVPARRPGDARRARRRRLHRPGDRGRLSPGCCASASSARRCCRSCPPPSSASAARAPASRSSCASARPSRRCERSAPASSTSGSVRPPIEPDESLRTEVVLRERTVAALPEGHPLAALRRIPLRRLAAEPLVLFPRDQAPGFHDLLDRPAGRDRHAAARRPVRTGDADDHRPGRGRDRSVPGTRVGGRTSRLTASPTGR